LAILLIILGLVIAVRWQPYLWLLVPLIGLCVGYLLLLWWAGQQGYLYFEGLPQDAPPIHPLLPNKVTPVRASGWFTVEGQNQYYVHLEAEFQTVATREHIIMARVHPSRFLLLGRWPQHELGWWYVFFQPTMIRKVQVGRLHFGPKPHLALQVTYVSEEKKHKTICLTFDNTSTLQEVWGDLLYDAPPDVAAG
jgi:hypothetical protein